MFFLFIFNKYLLLKCKSFTLLRLQIFQKTLPVQLETLGFTLPCVLHFTFIFLGNIDTTLDVFIRCRLFTCKSNKKWKDEITTFLPGSNPSSQFGQLSANDWFSISFA